MWRKVVRGAGGVDKTRDARGMGGRLSESEEAEARHGGPTQRRKTTREAGTAGVRQADGAEWGGLQHRMAKEQRLEGKASGPELKKCPRCSGQVALS